MVEEFVSVVLITVDHSLWQVVKRRKSKFSHGRCLNFLVRWRGQSSMRFKILLLNFQSLKTLNSRLVWFDELISM